MPIHLSPARIRLISGGERGGKSRLSAVEPCLYILENIDKPDKLIWIVASTYELAKPEFSYALEDLKKLGLVHKNKMYLPRQGSQEVRGPNYRLLTKSSDDVLRLAAEAPDCVLMCEAAQQTNEVFLRLRGRVAEKRGNLIMSGTFEGSLNWFAEHWRKWQHPNSEGAVSFSVPTWSNTIIYPGGENDPEILKLKETYPPSLFQERFGAVPCPPSTLVFPEFRYEIHTRQNLTPDWDDFYGEIELAIDPGYQNAYAVLPLWVVGEQVFVVDEIYRRHTKVGEIIAEAKDRPWWPYVTGGVIDVAAKAHPAQASQIEIWEQMAEIDLRSQFVHIQDGIDRYRSFLDSPVYSTDKQSGLPGARIFYDRDNCPNSIAEHGKYKYRDIKEGRPANEKPIDSQNDAMKAIAYYLVDRFGYIASLRVSNVIQFRPKFPRRKKLYVGVN